LISFAVLDTEAGKNSNQERIILWNKF
jgi:hypothetical protein